MIIKHGRHIFGEIHQVRKGMWAFFAFRVLIGWASKLWSRGGDHRKTKGGEFEARHRLQLAVRVIKAANCLVIDEFKGEKDAKRREAVRRKTAQYLLKAEALYTTYLAEQEKSNQVSYKAWKRKWEDSENPD